MSPTTDEHPTASAIHSLMLPRIIWGSLLMSHLLLGVVLYVVKVPSLGADWIATTDFSPNGIVHTFLTTLQNPINTILTVVAGTAALAGLVIPKILFKATARKKPSDPLESVGRYPRALDAGASFPFFMMRLALFEMVALIGFIQGFVIPGNPVFFIPFVLVSVSLHVSQFPRDLSLGFERKDETAL